MCRESRREKRIRRTENVIRSRVQYINTFWEHPADSRLLKQPHRLSKKHPADCGKSKCKLCHYEKVLGIERKKYKGRRVDVTLS